MSDQRHGENGNPPQPDDDRDEDRDHDHDADRHDWDPGDDDGALPDAEETLPDRG